MEQNTGIKAVKGTESKKNCFKSNGHGSNGVKYYFNLDDQTGFDTCREIRRLVAFSIPTMEDSKSGEISND